MASTWWQCAGPTVTRIALDRSSEQVQRLLDPGPATFIEREGTTQLGPSSGRAYEELATNVELLTKFCLYIASKVDKLVTVLNTSGDQ